MQVVFLFVSDHREEAAVPGRRVQLGEMGQGSLTSRGC